MEALDGLPRLPPDLRGINVRDFLEDAVRAVPGRPFVVGRDAMPLSYAEFDYRVNRTAAAWQGLGVAKGDRVAFMLENSPSFLVAWLALAKIGAILVAVNTHLKPAEVGALVKTANVDLALSDDQHQATLRAASQRIRMMSTRDLLSMAESALPEFKRPALAANDPVSLIFTSGTTGRSKAVVQTHGNFVLTGQAFPWWLELEPGARFYCCLPLFHANAQAYSTMGAIGNKGTLILVDRFSASRFWDDMRTYRPHIVNYIGAMIAILTKRDPSPDERDHDVRAAFGVPKFPEEQLREIEKRFGFKLISGHGMSETTFGLIESLDHRPPGTIGRPRLHPDRRLTNEARVVDEDGNDVSPGDVGELVYRSAMIMQGYFNDPEGTSAAIRDGWLHTGDYASMDANGIFSFIDRKKDIIRRRGENISSLEVELTLMEHPAVEEAAVVGVPAEVTDEDVLALVVLRTGFDVDPAELAVWCDARLAGYKVPRYVQFVATLPKTPTQKVDKTRLRAQIADRTLWYEHQAGRKR